MSGGTVALVIAVLQGLPTSGGPEYYSRHAIFSGPTEGMPMEKFLTDDLWAGMKLEMSHDPMNETPGENNISPLGGTVASCNAYARRMMPLFEEGAEQELKRPIADYRCVYIPRGYQLIDYSDPYDRSNPRHIVPKDPYKLEKMPEPERRTGPACLYMHPEYPAEAEEDSVEGEVTAECDNIRGIDGYYRAKNCHVVKLVVKGDDGKELPKDVGFEQSALNFFEQGGGCRPSPSRIYHVNFTIIGDDD